MTATHPAATASTCSTARWYADDPHEVWSWMRREAPVYYDEVSDVWGIARYDDVLAIEKDPRTFSSRRAPRPHGTPLPMMISMDDPEHQRRRSLVNRGFTPRRIAEHGGRRSPGSAGASSTGCARRARATSCGTWPRRCRCMVIADLLGFDERRPRRPAPLVRRHAPGHRRRPAPPRCRDRAPTPCSASASCQLRGHRRAPGRPPRRPHQHPVRRPRSTGTASTTSRS